MAAQTDGVDETENASKEIKLNSRYDYNAFPVVSFISILRKITTCLPLQLVQPS